MISYPSDEFARQFFRAVKVPLQFRAAGGATAVRFFGIQGEASDAYRGSVRVLAWRPVDRSHAIQIRCKAADDTLIVYLPAKPQDFATACRWLRTWRDEPAPATPPAYGSWADPRLHSRDVVQIPYVALEGKADFLPRLGSLRSYANQPVPRVISRAEQLTRFNLHERGAEVRVEASGMSEPFGSDPESPPVHPRDFIYDRPFFVFLWRERAEWPYFGAWVGDASALKPFQ